MMTLDQRSRAVTMLRALRQDIAADVRRRDGLILSGRSVGTALGEICAQVDALAHVLIDMLDDAKPLVVTQSLPGPDLPSTGGGQGT